MLGDILAQSVRVRAVTMVSPTVVPYGERPVGGVHALDVVGEPEPDHLLAVGSRDVRYGRIVDESIQSRPLPLIVGEAQDPRLDIAHIQRALSRVSE